MSKKIILVMQQGGSTAEWYTHAHNTVAEAKADIKSCSINGSYKTYGPVTVPPALAKTLQTDKHAEQEFYTLIEEIVCECVRVA
jgi:endo-1,4-beta-D-glucanase Y